MNIEALIAATLSRNPNGATFAQMHHDCLLADDLGSFCRFGLDDALEAMLKGGSITRVRGGMDVSMRAYKLNN